DRGRGRAVNVARLVSTHAARLCDKASWRRNEWSLALRNNCEAGRVAHLFGRRLAEQEGGTSGCNSGFHNNLRVANGLTREARIVGFCSPAWMVVRGWRMREPACARSRGGRIPRVNRNHPANGGSHLQWIVHGSSAADLLDHGDAEGLGYCEFLR